MALVEQFSPLTEASSSRSYSATFLIRHLLLLCGLGMFLFFIGLGYLPLLEPDEGRNAEVAREMLSSGDWITPHFNSLPYLDKPAVFFWLVALSFRVWGISEWAARFPSAMMALATMLLTWFLARRMFGERTGLYAGIVLTTTPLVIAFARLVIFDMTLACLLTLAMVSLWYAETNTPRPVGLDVLAFAAMGVATITKGPVGFLLPLLSVAAYYAWRQRLGDLRRLNWGWGVVAFLVTILPWFLAVSIRNPDFPRYALWQESIQRFATGHARRTGGVLYYVPVYLAGLFPWSIFLLCAAWNRVSKWRELRDEANRPIAFLLAWAGVIFVFFTISRSKLPAYFLPAAVPLTILTAQVWTRMESREERRPPRWVRAGFVSLAAAGLLVALASQLFDLEAVRIRFATKFPPSLISSIKLSTFYTGLIIVALGIVGRNLVTRERGGHRLLTSFVLLALTVPLIVVRWSAPLTAYANNVSSRQLARTILASPEKDLPVYGYFYFRNSLPFYLQRPVYLVTSEGGEMTSNYVVSRVRENRREQVPFSLLLIDAPHLYIKARSVGPGMLVMARDTAVEELVRTIGEIEPRWNGWAYSIWKVSQKKP